MMIEFVLRTCHNHRTQNDIVLFLNIPSSTNFLPPSCPPSLSPSLSASRSALLISRPELVCNGELVGFASTDGPSRQN
eukprot:scaffold23513_cov62-Attheya_sp.AAC.3